MQNIYKIMVLSTVLGLSACNQQAQDPAVRFQSAVTAYEAEQYHAAKDFLAPLAEDGNADAQFMLAELYTTDKLGEADHTLGTQWLSRAADTGHVKAMSMMGVRYLNGAGVEEDIPRAVDLLTKAALAKNAKAQLLMGFLHSHGKGVDQDDNSAARYYYAAARNGDGDAAARLVTLSEQGAAEAVTYAGLLYKDGVGVETNAIKAAELVLKGAEQNFGLAQHMISHAYGAGQGFEQDYLKAHMWANLAAANGHDGAEKRRDTWSQLMTPEQIAEAQTMARDWTAAIDAAQD